VLLFCSLVVLLVTFIGCTVVGIYLRMTMSQLRNFSSLRQRTVWIIIQHYNTVNYYWWEILWFVDIWMIMSYGRQHVLLFTVSSSLSVMSRWDIWSTGETFHWQLRHYLFVVSVQVNYLIDRWVIIIVIILTLFDINCNKVQTLDMVKIETK